MVRLSKLYTLIILTRKQLTSANVSQLNLSIYRFNNLHLMDTCISKTVSPSCRCEIQRNIEQTCQKSDIFVLLLSAANEVDNNGNEKKNLSRLRQETHNCDCVTKLLFLISERKLIRFRYSYLYNKFHGLFVDE